jgi:hypothetical protein
MRLLIALLPIPFGFAGVSLLAAIVGAMTGFVVAYYAVMGSVLLAAAVCACFGLMRLYGPVLWERLETVGLIRYEGRIGLAIEQLDPATQAGLLLIAAAVLLAIGVGLFWGSERIMRWIFAFRRVALRRLPSAVKSLERRLRHLYAEGSSLKDAVHAHFNAGRPIPL